MALADDIPDGALVAFDTNSIIYFIEQESAYFSVVERAFTKVVTGRIYAHVSAVSLIEVLVKPIRDRQDALAQRYRLLLNGTRGLTLHDVNVEISEGAADIRARWNLRVPDAIVAATALWSGCTHLVTNDPDFKRVQGLEALIVDDYV